MGEKWMISLPLGELDILEIFWQKERAAAA